MQKTITCLMFVGEQAGKAEEAVHFYVTLFKDSKIQAMFRYEEGDGDVVGTIKHAEFFLDGQEYMAMDSSLMHNFTFTPATSIFVRCENEEEVYLLFGKLSEHGTILMPLDSYPFSKKYAWVNDRYGVSWQLFYN